MLQLRGWFLFYATQTSISGKQKFEGSCLDCRVQATRTTANLDDSYTLRTGKKAETPHQAENGSETR
jgi:hypothetical protein